MGKKSMNINSPPKEFCDKYCPRTISGGLIDSKDLAGYCHYDAHKGYLLQKHIKEHQCVAKECHYLEKNLSSDYFNNYYFTRKKRKIEKRLKALCNDHVISVSAYMNYSTMLKNVKNNDELEDFYELRVQIETDMKSLLEINMKGGDDSEC